MESAREAIQGVATSIFEHAERFRAVREISTIYANSDMTDEEFVARVFDVIERTT